MKAKKYLKGGQVKLDANKDGKISGKDFSMLRKGIKKYQKGGKAPKGERDYGSDGLVGLTLGEAERRADKEAKYSKNVKQKRTSKFNENLERERVARLKAEQSVAFAEGEKGKKLRQLERQDPAAYNRVMESARQEAESGMRTRLMRRNMKKGGKVVKYEKVVPTPSPTERTLTEDDRRIIMSPGNQGNADYKGYNRTKTPKEILEGSEMRRLKNALRKNKYGTNGMSLADMRKVAKTKGFYDEARGLAREDYQKEMAKRR